MATGTKGELASVNTSVSILASLPLVLSARFIPAQDKDGQGAEKQQLDRITWIFTSIRKVGTLGPSKYRRAISLPTLETSLSFTVARKTLVKAGCQRRGGFGDRNAIGGGNVGTEN